MLWREKGRQDRTRRKMAAELREAAAEGDSEAWQKRQLVTATTA